MEKGSLYWFRKGSFKSFFVVQEAKECFCEIESPKHHRAMQDFAHHHQRPKDNVFLTAMGSFSYPTIQNYQDETKRKNPKVHALVRAKGLLIPSTRTKSHILLYTGMNMNLPCTGGMTEHSLCTNPYMLIVQAQKAI